MDMRIFCLATATLIALMARPVLAETYAGPLAPRDQCAATEGLAAFGEKLRHASQARDADALLELADDNIKLDFGGGSGKAELKQRLTSPEYTLWEELGAALSLGCGISSGVDGQGFASWPWYFSKDIIPLDPFEAFIVTGEQVRLRRTASRSAPVIGAVSWDYVRLRDYPPEDAAYAKVETRNGSTGYIAKSYLRSLVDYRLVAEKRDGKWLLSAFIAGD
jgi:hypothetical protein